MKKIVDYKIADGNSHQILEAHVLRLLKEGYQPHGNMYAATGGGSGFFLQAMVKYEEEVKVDSKKVL